ncbi:MAG: NUDIX domain-containing protein [Pseudolabrys sp.]|nr:NUDIX domain-containing protein [Pseudolabrys sp.]
MRALSAIRIACEPLLRRILHFYWRFSRGATLGTRAVVIDAQGRIFLVRHSYVAGWHLPGGGVETGESMMDALERELREEGHIELTAPPVLHGLFHNAGVSRRDYVALYVVRDFRQDSLPKPNYEIVETGFFTRDALPDGTTKATRARLAEIFDGTQVSPRW